MNNNSNNFRIIKSELNRIALLNMIRDHRHVCPTSKFCEILNELYQNHSDVEYYTPIDLEFNDSQRSSILILKALQDLGLARTWESAHTNLGIEQQAVPTHEGFQFLDHFLGKPKAEKAKVKSLQRVRRILSNGLFSIAVLGLILVASIEVFTIATGDLKFMSINTMNDPVVYLVATTSISLLLSSWISNKLKALSKRCLTKELMNQATSHVHEDKMLLYLFNNNLIQHQMSHISQETLFVIDQMLFDS